MNNSFFVLKNYCTINQISRLIFFLSLQFCINPVFAQTYEPGILFFVSGEQKKGLLERSTLVNSSKQIRFKSAPTGDVETYYPQKVSSFKYDADQATFESVLFEHYKQDDKVDKTKVQKERFAKVLVAGEVSLLKVQLFQDEYNGRAFESKAQLYLLKKQDQYTQLDLLKIQYIDGVYRVSKKYKGLLSHALKECAKIEKLAARTEFNDRAMIRIIKEYHECIGATSSMQTNNSQAEKAVRQYVSAGTILVRDEFLEKPFGLNIGYSASFFNPELSKRLGTTFGFDLVFTRYDWNDSQVFIGSYNEQNLRANLLLDYHLLKKPKHQLKLSLGFSIYLYLNSSKDVLFEGTRSFVLLPFMATYTTGKYNFYISSAGQGEHLTRPDKIINIGFAYQFK